MIFGKSVHTVHFWFLWINFNVIGGEWFEVGCTLVCTKSDHFRELIDKRLKHSLCDVILSSALYWQLSAQHHK